MRTRPRARLVDIERPCLGQSPLRSLLHDVTSGHLRRRATLPTVGTACVLSPGRGRTSPPIPQRRPVSQGSAESRTPDNESMYDADTSGTVMTPPGETVWLPTRAGVSSPVTQPRLAQPGNKTEYMMYKHR